MSVLVVVPTYTNAKGLLNLLNQLSDFDGPVVVVDNQPSEEKKHAVRHSLQKGIYLPQSTNTGFARAVNIGVRQGGTYEWVAILNDDVSISKTSFVHFADDITAYANRQKWSAVSPVVQKPDGLVEQYGYTVLPIGKVQLNFDTQKKDSTVLDGISAACLFIRKEVFDALQGFDESFFAYLEDVDLCLRMKHGGYTFGICPDISVVHNQLTTSQQMGSFKQQRDFVNWIRIIAKHWGGRKIIQHLPGILIERLRNINGILKSL